MKCVCIISALLCAVGCIHAQNTIAVEQYTKPDGLTSNTIICLLQDSRGFLWIGTDNGLNRFNGRTFTQYNITGNRGLTDANIKCIAEDAEGYIWIGTEFGLNRLNVFTDSITRYYEGAGAGTIPYKWCNSLYSDKNKTLWLGTEKGIARYDKTTNTFTNYPIQMYGADAKINKQLSCMLEDSKGRFWLGTSYGVKFFDRKSKKNISLHFPEKNQPLYENAIYSLFENADGTVLAGTYNGNLLRYNESTHAFEKIKINNDSSVHLIIHSIIPFSAGQENSLLLLTNNGGKKMNVDGNALSMDTLPGFPNEYITAAKSTAANNLWIATLNGLFKISFGSPVYEKITLPSGDERVYHLLPDITQPNKIFYGNQNNGWNRLDIEQKKIDKFSLPKGAEKNIAAVNNWIADDKGYWLASQEGFGYYNFSKNRFTDLTNLILTKSGQKTTRFLIKDKYNRLWTSMRRTGLLVYNPVTKTSTTLFADTLNPDNVYTQSINDLKTEDGSTVYFTCREKLYKINTADYSYTTFTAPTGNEQISTARISPKHIYLTPGNRVLVSSSKCIYELKNGKLFSIFPQKGYTSFTMEKMYGDQFGRIWLFTDDAVYKTDTSFQNLINVSNWFNYPANSVSEMLVLTKDKILLAQKGAFGIVQESLFQKPNKPLAVLVSSVKYGTTEKLMVSVNAAAINVNYKDAVAFELSSVEQLENRSSKILYQLQGWDNGWKELTTGSVVRYEQLPPDSYIFKTKAVNAENNESEETTIRFTVVPPFYRTGWFIALVVFIIAAVTFWFYRYRLRKAIEMEKMRTRIATDLHDDIGATLSSISIYSQALKTQIKEKNSHIENVLDKMGENSRDMVSNMSDIVWAINPSNDDGSKMLSRMESYATDICAVKNIQLHFTAAEKIKDKQLQTGQRKNIYLIFKEAMNNAVKYADAKNIWINIATTGSTLELSIKDDGNGFDMEKVRKGNGLTNMQLRANEINGHLQIKVEPGYGTSILFTCKL